MPGLVSGDWPMKSGLGLHIARSEMSKRSKVLEVKAGNVQPREIWAVDQ